MAASKKKLTVKRQRSMSLAWFFSGMVSLFGFGVIFWLIFSWDTSENGVEKIGELNRKLCVVITLGLFEISFVLMAVANYIVSAIERSGSGTEFPEEEYCCPHCNEPIQEGATICHACRGVLVWVQS